MNRFLSSFRLLAVLCCAALLCAQVFGVMRGYWCACSGQAQWTAQDHCHGPHGASCHEGGATVAGHSEENDLGGRQDHQQVRDEVRSRLVSTLEAPALVPQLVAVLENENAAPRAPEILPQAAATESRGSPPGVLIARTVVLLI